MKEKQANIALSRITGKGKEFLSGNAYGKEVFQELASYGEVEDLSCTKQ